MQMSDRRELLKILGIGVPSAFVVPRAVTGEPQYARMTPQEAFIKDTNNPKTNEGSKIVLGTLFLVSVLIWATYLIFGGKEK